MEGKVCRLGGKVRAEGCEHCEVVMSAFCVMRPSSIGMRRGYKHPVLWKEGFDPALYLCDFPLRDAEVLQAFDWITLRE